MKLIRYLLLSLILFSCNNSYNIDKERAARSVKELLLTRYSDAEDASVDTINILKIERISEKEMFKLAENSCAYKDTLLKNAIALDSNHLVISLQLHRSRQEIDTIKQKIAELIDGMEKNQKELDTLKAMYEKGNDTNKDCFLLNIHWSVLTNHSHKSYTNHCCLDKDYKAYRAWVY